MPLKSLSAIALGSLALLAAAPAAPAQAPTAVLRGVVYDSLVGAPLGGALVQAAPVGDLTGVRSVRADSLGRFRFDSLPAGRWLVGFDHGTVQLLALEMPTRVMDLVAGDSADAPLALPGARRLHRVLCEAAGDSTGSLVGQVLGAESGMPIEGARVVVSWPELEIGRGRIQTVVRRVPLPLRDGGSYLACGVPTDVDLTLRAEAPTAASGDVVVTVKAGALQRQDLTLGERVAGAPSAPSARSGGARLAGTVRDERGRPIANARVLVLGVEGRSATASEAGAFAIDSLPSGSWTVEARAIGFAPSRATAQLSTSRAADARIVMAKQAAQLDRVVVMGKRMSASTRALTDALDRVHRYGGTLISPADLERRQPLWPSDLFRTIPGMQVLFNSAGSVIRGRGGCTPRVLLDGMPIQNGADDLDRIVSAADMMAVEVYRGLLGPAEFSGPQGGGCGTIAVWTKR
jgi:hypothetical protein